jgi:methylated-DNA-[protein]-cysteine S-methyltransferase
MTGSPFYVLLPSAFGVLAVVWRDTMHGAQVQRVLLPGRQMTTEQIVGREYPQATPLSCSGMDELAGQMQRFLEGEAVKFPLDAIAMEHCSGIQQRVLRAEHGIPRGWVSTYGRIAHHLGVSGGARAVGRALATNPFPIIIPCHRAIRSNGELGGYQGGPDMKRTLLEMEGVAFSSGGKVLAKRMYYQSVETET